MRWINTQRTLNVQETIVGDYWLVKREIKDIEIIECFTTRLDLSAEAVESASLALESVDHVHGGHGLALGVLAVGDGVTDDVLEEYLKLDIIRILLFEEAPSERRGSLHRSDPRYASHHHDERDDGWRAEIRKLKKC